MFSEFRSIYNAFQIKGFFYDMIEEIVSGEIKSGDVAR